MIARATSWMTGTPMLPPPAFSPSAHPFFLSGKKALMLVMEEAKLPPPMPASRPIQRKVSKDVPGFITTNAAMVGMSSRLGGDDRPVPPAEDGDREGVRHPDDRADERDHRRQQELVGRGQPVLRAHEEHQHGPQGPDREADVLGEHGEDEVAPGDLLTGLPPEGLVLRIPVLDPQ
jgi:hypothetical protein